MGNVDFFYPLHKKFITRAIVRGFVMPVGCSGSVLAGMDLQTFYAPGNQFLTMRLQTRFYNPSSNRYSLDYVFDLANCWSYVAGVPTYGTVAIEIGIYDPDPNWRIRLGVGLPPDLSQVVDLPALAGYWKPFG